MLKKAKSVIKFGLEPIGNVYKDVNVRKRTLYTEFWNKIKVDEKIIAYESYHGKNATGNVYAIFKEIQSNSEFKDYKHIWFLNEKEGESAIELRKYRNVTIVDRESIEYLKYLCKAKFLINDTSFPSYFNKKEDQVYINTWHGTPLKTIGKDIVNADISAHGNIQKNMLQVDYLVSPNKFTQETLLNANGIKGIFNGKIAELGYPRVDATLKTNKIKIKKRLNLDLEKKILLYAPTWRDSQLSQEKSLERITEDFKKLKQEFSDEYQIILKVHYFIYKKFEEEGFSEYCISDAIDTNELLSCVDVLVTDYSSIFFDFLPTKKPILFYTYDLEEYKEERGLYMDEDKLPGPICKEIEELITGIKVIEANEKIYKSNYDHFLKEYCYLDDGFASKRVVEEIILGYESEKVYKLENDKKKILIWGGGFAMNGITVSLINLLNNIDYKKNEVTLIYASKFNEETLSNLHKVNKNVNIIYKKGMIASNIFEAYSQKLVMKYGLNSKKIEKIKPEKMYKRELQRILGNCEFDVAIDYCGYTPYWSLLFAHSDIKNKNIYLHSDMFQDSNKKINGKLKHKNNLQITFNLYKKFDKIVCVSEDSMKANYEKLSKYIKKEQIIKVDNAIDYNKVISTSKEMEIMSMNNKDHYVIQNKMRENVNEVSLVEKMPNDWVKFVNVGRISPEKDHIKLIKAFKRYNDYNKKSVLYIVGDGVLKKELKAEIKKYKLEDKVILTGALNEPYSLINVCDCFVSSSNYEGQGLAIIEAMILNKPVISTNIPGPRGLLENNKGLLVENTVEGLYEGMKEFGSGNLNFEKFDYKEYNENSIKTFVNKVLNK